MGKPVEHETDGVVNGISWELACLHFYKRYCRFDVKQHNAKKKKVSAGKVFKRYTIYPLSVQVNNI